MITINRILCLLLCAMTTLVWPSSLRAADAMAHTDVNVPTEIKLTASLQHQDPFNSITLDVVVTDGAGGEQRVPAFWAGGAHWTARYAAPRVGTYHWRSESNTPDDASLQGQTGVIDIGPYHGENPLFLHGPIRVAADKRHFEYGDGTPFFWLGDTWWMGLSKRLHWPEDVTTLAADRKAKGFNVIQMVAGLYPDMFPFDPRGANEAGFPWEKDYARIRPEFFDAADTRITYLIDQGFSPCIVGAWGYFLKWMTVAQAKQQWRYLIARYGAYPVIWCVAGEANLNWYQDPGFPRDDREQVHGWTDVARYLRATDPFHRMVTIHPTGLGALDARGAIDDQSLLDFDMLQTPHGELGAVKPTDIAAKHSFACQPIMPVLNGEAAFENLGGQIHAEWSRAMFWICMMDGAAGHTYGANGIWQNNRRGDPHGNSPTGGTYGTIPWDDAMNLPGSRQVGMAKKFLSELPWTKLTPMPAGAALAQAPVWGDWIWYPDPHPQQDAPVATRYLRHSFTLPVEGSITNAMLRISADDRFTVWINGTLIGSGADWATPNCFPLSSVLHAGANAIAVKVENLPTNPPGMPDPAGLLASLLFKIDGKPMQILSDSSWSAENSEIPGWTNVSFDDAHWPKALVAAHFGEGPWGKVSDPNSVIGPYTCGIGDGLRVIYLIAAQPVIVNGLTPLSDYHVVYFNPDTCERTTPVSIRSEADGSLLCPPPAYSHDWAAVISR